MKYRVYSKREYFNILKYNGFELDRVKGDHFYFKRGSDIIETTLKPNPILTHKSIKKYNLIEKRK